MAASSPPRRQAPFLIGLVLILAALPAGYFAFLRQPPPPPVVPQAVAPEAKPPPPEVKPSQVEMVLRDFLGAVEVRHGGADWAPAQKGISLRPTDSVRTGKDSWAELVNGQALEVRMENDTDVSVETLTAQLSRLQLGSGVVSAVVRSGQGLEVRARGGGARAESRGGAFTLESDGKGTLEVGTREGEVKLVGKDDQAVIVPQGKRSIVRPGQAPVEPTLPEALVVNVDWPPEGKHLRKHDLVVSGRTNPGNRVRVGGVLLRANADGQFQQKVVLEDGDHLLKVEVTNVMGERQASEHPVKVDTRAPKTKADTNGLW